MSSSHTETTATLVDVTMPQMGVSVAEGTVVAWRVEPGDRIAADETICEISTDKIDTEVPAPVSGVVAEIVVPVETTVDVGTVLARIATAMVRIPQPPGDDAPAETATAPTPAAAPTHGAHASNGHNAQRPRDGRRYSPVVQRIAAEHDVDLSAVEGTGRGGRVRKQDVLAFIESAPEAPLHIESPYRPDPVPTAAPAVASTAPGTGTLAPAASCPGCAGRSAST